MESSGSSPSQLTCPRCNGENKPRTRFRVLNDEVIEQYFECEHCHFKQSFGRTTRKIENLRKDIAKLQHRAMQTTNSRYMRRLIARKQKQLERELLTIGQ